MKTLIKQVILFVLMTMFSLNAQIDSTESSKLKFTGDFRFRVEHDWQPKSLNDTEGNNKSKDRSRLRYRFRFGATYSLDKNSSFSGRIRTGNINDQQGPHLTIGGNRGEFGLAQIGFEKLYYQYKSNNFTGWIGKNSIPLVKLNELFWNDNVFPEGIGLKFKSNLKNTDFLNSLSVNAGHFIIAANNQTFDKDTYLQILQLEFKLLDKKISLFPGYYFFKNVGNTPDGTHSFNLDYSILHLGSQFEIFNKPLLRLGAEYYHNFQDYSDLDLMSEELKDERSGFVFSLKLNKLKEKGDWTAEIYYANLQKYSIVDYFAQNDWVRWDYSSINAKGSRTSNIQGVELRFGYAIKEKFNLILRSYFVEELMNLENNINKGNRIRLDLNIGF